jgi:subtilisin family serine protease
MAPIGLVDTGVHGAAATVACFGAPGGDALADHGTRSAWLVRDAAPGARLAIATVAAADGTIAPAAIAAAIDWLIDGGARVIAVPLGSDRDDRAIAAAIDRALAGGAIVVAAAGDSHPAPVMFPARHPGVLSVGAVDHRGRLLPECNRAPRLALRAPGLARGGRGSSIACVLAAAAIARTASPQGDCP